MGKVPERTCIGCNLKKDKKELIRIVKNKNGEIKVDLKGKLEGRGTYICRNEECLNKSIKNKKLLRTLDISADNNILENLKNAINGGEVIE